MQRDACVSDPRCMRVSSVAKHRLSSAGADETSEHSAPVFAALGDVTRLRVVTRLCQEGPLSITCLAEGVQVSRQAVSKHLRVLADAGLVKGTRAGRTAVWKLEPRGIAEARRLLEGISREWDDTLERLREFVETPLHVR